MVEASRSLEARWLERRPGTTTVLRMARRTAPTIAARHQDFMEASVRSLLDPEAFFGVDPRETSC
jgi:hypothetical protein